MHNNYYFLRQLSKVLAERLGVSWRLGWRGERIAPIKAQPMRLGLCFSQNKDELILGFYRPNEDFYIRAALQKDLSALNFLAEFFRAKRNSVDLFTEALDVPLQEIVQHLNERSFTLRFAQGYDLLFKMHGRRANIILFEQGAFLSGFHKKMLKDQTIELSSIDRAIDQSYQAFEKVNHDWKKLYPTFGREIKNYFQYQKISEKSPQDQWQLIQDLLQELDSPPFYVINYQEDPQFSLLAPEYLQEDPDKSLVSDEPVAAINEFFYAYSKVNHLRQEKNEVLKTLQKKIKQGQNYMEKSMERLFGIEEGSRNEETANILMANLHQIQTGISSVTLYDFYQDTERKIKLKKDLSPQKNAEVYYRKAKNEKIEIQTLQKNIERKEREIEEIKNHIQEIETIDNIKELRRYFKKHKLEPRPSANEQKPDQHLFKKFAYRGFDIWVGKNAKNNDLLTQQYAHKEDLWLHAKDVSGSHVVIKYQAGKTFPQDVIEKAASLAAYYSKRSNDTLCPVIYTPKKFVRKTKDLAPGQVIVEKEEVLMVSPEKFE